MKRQPIVVGDSFQSRNGVIWTVTEAMGFGRGYWVVSDDRCRQTVYQRNVLETMQRVIKDEIHRGTTITELEEIVDNTIGGKE